MSSLLAVVSGALGGQSDEAPTAARVPEGARFGFRLAGYEAEFSCDGSHIVGTVKNGVLALWDAKNGVEAKRYVLTYQEATSFISRARTVDRFLLQGKRSLLVWDCHKTELTDSIDVGDDITASAISPTGDLVAASVGKSVLLYDLKAPKERRILKGHSDVVCALKFSPDGKHMASASYDGTLRIWSTSDLHEVAILKGHEGHVYGLAYSPDGLQLASCGEDCTVRIWRIERGSSTHVLKGHRKAATCVGFSPSGRFLASGSSDRDVITWEMATGQQVSELNGHHEALSGISFGANDTALVSVDTNGLVLGWKDRCAGVVAKKLKESDVLALWTSLASPKASDALEAAWVLARSGEDALSFLERQLMDIPNEECLRKAISALDSEDLAVRDEASSTLRSAGPEAEALLNTELERGLTPEKRSRIESLTRRLQVPLSSTSDMARKLRALTVLELLNTAGARRVLTAYAKVTGSCSLKVEATNSLQRMK
jgi:hypothetical protein